MHDFLLYDWRETRSLPRVAGSPRIARRENARKNLNLCQGEEIIINTCGAALNSLSSNLFSGTMIGHKYWAVREAHRTMA